LLASKISHRNILRIHNLNEFEGTNYITMAFIEGKDLNQLLKLEGPFPLERTLNIIRQLCEALDAAHTEGVVHRDFKPHNVLVGKDDHVYVSDFGLATSLESAQMGMTRTGAVVGTPRDKWPSLALRHVTRSDDPIQQTRQLLRLLSAGVALDQTPFGLRMSLCLRSLKELGKHAINGLPVS
jgi:serine/threonine protein kinase